MCLSMAVTLVLQCLECPRYAFRVGGGGCIYEKEMGGPPHKLNYMGQSRIEIEYYSVAYFERITKRDAL